MEGAIFALSHPKTAGQLNAQESESRDLNDRRIANAARGGV
jgi:hypothetical protein